MCARWAKHKASWRSTSPAFQAIQRIVGDRSVICLCDAIAVTSLCPNRGGETPASPEGAPGGQGSLSPGPSLLRRPMRRASECVSDTPEVSPARLPPAGTSASPSSLLVADGEFESSRGIATRQEPQGPYHEWARVITF